MNFIGKTFIPLQYPQSLPAYDSSNHCAIKTHHFISVLQVSSAPLENLHLIFLRGCCSSRRSCCCGWRLWCCVHPYSRCRRSRMSSWILLRASLRWVHCLPKSNMHKVEWNKPEFLFFDSLNLDAWVKDYPATLNSYKTTHLSSRPDMIGMHICAFKMRNSWWSISSWTPIRILQHKKAAYIFLNWRLIKI